LLLLADELSSILSMTRLVVHFQITDDAVERLGRVMDKMLDSSSASSNKKA